MQPEGVKIKGDTQAKQVAFVHSAQELQVELQKEQLLFALII
jgi:hypothetical protein